MVSSLLSKLEAAEARVAQLKREIKAADCSTYGCTWESYGGANAGCELGDSCGCSVPVNICSKCEDCDYGENPEAVEIRRKCRESASEI